MPVTTGVGTIISAGQAGAKGDMAGVDKSTSVATSASVDVAASVGIDDGNAVKVGGMAVALVALGEDIGTGAEANNWSRNMKKPTTEISRITLVRIKPALTRLNQPALDEGKLPSCPNAARFNAFASSLGVA